MTDSVLLGLSEATWAGLLGVVVGGLLTGGFTWWLEWRRERKLAERLRNWRCSNYPRPTGAWSGK
jgi:hypothetical protein